VTHLCVLFAKFNYYSLNNSSHTTDWENKIFDVSFYNFDRTAIELFNFQYQNNPLYRSFTDSLNIHPDTVTTIDRIPFLHIQFFKTHAVKTTDFDEEIIFESSGTTQSVTSKHFVKDVSIYKKSFCNTFELFYGAPEEWCILALLPSYVERKNASLVMMANELIKRSLNPLSGFYLHNHEKLHQLLLHNEIRKQPTLLIGVTFALLDFAEKYQMKLRYTIIMETGGMKGRRQEMVRKELYQQLQNRLGISAVHSEYGMTEIMSQAYSRNEGLYKCAPWMKILIREEDDPLQKQLLSIDKKPLTGLINIIDLANIYSCAFIATDDIGKLHHTGYFEVLGRRDYTDLRGCNLLVV
jgi:phenylacetate-coenzyme A ligase PaaK-like adenylate-forming protein